jgi:hypothetical protein
MHIQALTLHALGAHVSHSASLGHSPLLEAAIGIHQNNQPQHHATALITPISLRARSFIRH